jgi:hypothetical protein
VCPYFCQRQIAWDLSLENFMCVYNIYNGSELEVTTHMCLCGQVYPSGLQRVVVAERGPGWQASKHSGSN